MGLRELLRELWWDLKAWRRGERRVLPRGSRGRVYQRKNEKDHSGKHEAKGKPKGSISVRVYRAATDTWEDHGVVSKPAED